MCLLAWCLIKHMERFLYQCGEFVVCVVILVIWARCELSMLHTENKFWNFCAVWVLQHASQSNLQSVFLRLEACVSSFYCTTYQFWHDIHSRSWYLVLCTKASAQQHPEHPIFSYLTFCFNQHSYTVWCVCMYWKSIVHCPWQKFISSNNSSVLYYVLYCTLK